METLALGVRILVRLVTAKFVDTGALMFSFLANLALLPLLDCVPFTGVLLLTVGALSITCTAQFNHPMK